MQQIVSEFSDLASLGIQDFGNPINSSFMQFLLCYHNFNLLVALLSDAYIDLLENELNKVQVETTDVANEIQHLVKTQKDGQCHSLTHFSFVSHNRHGSIHQIIVFLFSPDSILLEARLEELECSIQYITSKVDTCYSTSNSLCSVLYFS